MKTDTPGPVEPRAGTEALGKLREQIMEVDREFVRLLARRQRLALRVAENKMGSGVPLRNYSVEKRVIERFSGLCEGFGLRAQWGVGLARFLIEKSVELQSQELDKRRLAGALDILVIGGFGKMGSWFCNFLNNQGHRVVVHDKCSAEASPFDSLSGLDENVRDFDFIILSVPLQRSPDVLEELLQMRPRGVLFDLCSLKRDLLPVIRRGIRAGLRLTSIHPLFGPDVTTLHGRKIIICPCGDEEADRDVRALFSETAATIVSLPPEDHDRLMTLTLGLSHALNFVFADALVNSGESFETLVGVGSSTFNCQISTTLKLVRENMDLYFEIQRLCDQGVIFRLLEEAVEKLGTLIAENRRGEFLDSMSTACDFFHARPREPGTADARDAS